MSGLAKAPALLPGVPHLSLERTCPAGRLPALPFPSCLQATPEGLTLNLSKRVLEPASTIPG